MTSVPLNHTLYVCTTCRKRSGDEIIDPEAGQNFYQAIAEQADHLQNFNIVQTECLSMCKRACAVAFSAEGKYSYLLANLDESMVDDLCKFAGTYAEKKDGIVKKVDRPDILKDKVQGRLPPFVKNNATT